MHMMRIQVYRGTGDPMGEIQVSIDAVHKWLTGLEDEQSKDLCDVRDLVDPDHENESYDWDIWARPAEVAADLE